MSRILRSYLVLISRATLIKVLILASDINNRLSAALFDISLSLSLRRETFQELLAETSILSCSVKIYIADSDENTGLARARTRIERAFRNISARRRR